MKTDLTPATAPLGKNPSDRLLGTAQVCRFLGKSKKWLLSKWRDPAATTFDESFPKPYKLSASSYAWSQGELQVWLDSVRVTVGEAA